VRPLRVELEGIGSFRQRAELDLAGVDLFVLSGPTGAGKTTLLIDAMALALYGTVPRYEDRRLVAPIISQGANEGRVRLTFGVGGRTFTATRVVRRTKQGATTKEARLEEVTGGGSTVHAGTADEVSAAVGGLLGLTFDQFCRSVVLPQGAFDRFLFAKPAERADLLIQLLDLGVHEEIGRRARALAAGEQARAAAADRRLQGDLATADPAELDVLADRIAVLDGLVDRCRTVQEQLDQLLDEGRDLRARADVAASDRDALGSLERPDDVDALAAATREAAAALTRAESARARADTDLDAAEGARARLPDAEVLGTLTRTAHELTASEAAVPELETAAAEAARAAEDAATDVTSASEQLAAARAGLDAARRDELVHTLRDGLHAGDDCPVCGTELAAEPPPAAADATEAATVELRLAEAELERRTVHQRVTDREHATAAARSTAAAERRDAARTARREALVRAGATDEEAAATVVSQVASADAAVRTARDADRVARQGVADTRRDLERARAQEGAAWSTFDAARDAVARLGPPSTDRQDLAAAWDTLLGWAERTRPGAVAAADEAAAQVREARERYAAVRGTLVSDVEAVGVEVASGATVAEAVAEALATARARHATLTARVAEVRAVTEERDAARAEAGVAEHVGKLLRADGFERWLLARALGRLVDGASALLRDLTSGAYSLALDPTNQFLVVDHRSADEPRTVRSLSGGERFLASLALALALADHVAELAADGAARLESLFLDEGFGTLDPDTLDVVAAALEELGARGRVVGIVTHVRDLAERLPVRFEVRKGPAGSSVERAAGEGDAADGVTDRQVTEGAA
jgi:DNA repair protein SbcC/Rad50